MKDAILCVCRLQIDQFIGPLETAEKFRKRFVAENLTITFSPLSNSRGTTVQADLEQDISRLYNMSQILKSAATVMGLRAHGHLLMFCCSEGSIHGLNGIHKAL